MLPETTVHYRPWLVSVVIAVTSWLVSPGMATAAEVDAAEPPTWEMPTTENVEQTVFDWLVQSAETDRQAAERIEQTRGSFEALRTGGDRLDALVEIVSVAAPPVGDLVVAVRQSPGQAASLEWLDSADVPYWMRNNVRLYVGRELVRQQFYEQALDVLSGIAPADVFDPASLLFYRAIAEHQLVRVDDAQETLASLLAAERPMPERFAQLARLMQADLTDVEDDSLDHIARRMGDVRRRLDLSQADDRTQEVERGILASLDKMIEQLEEQQRQQQQQQQQQQQAGGPPSGQPMEESRLAELKGEGKVDIKDIGEQSGWGDLPPRQRERVLQQIGRDFPGHYRDLMEEYLKRLATDEREEQQP